MGIATRRVWLLKTSNTPPMASAAKVGSASHSSRPTLIKNFVVRSLPKLIRLGKMLCARHMVSDADTQQEGRRIRVRMRWHGASI